MKNNNPVPKNFAEEKNKDKVHPWRLCPAGEHFVRTHQMHVPSSKEHPEGYETIGMPTVHVIRLVRMFFFLMRSRKLVNKIFQM
jgi:hypothetical protein